MIKLKQANNKPEFLDKGTVIFIKKDDLGSIGAISESQLAYVKAQLALDMNKIPVYHNHGISYIMVINNDDKPEDYRKKATELFSLLQKNKEIDIALDGTLLNSNYLLAFAEGLVLAAYQFLKYFKAEEKEKKAHQITSISCFHASDLNNEISYLQNVLKGVYWARDMVNEPLNSLNAVQFAAQVQNKGKEAGFNVEVLDKKKIESLQMGGLLAVNKGSIDPPTFTIATWKPENAVNKKPCILVGKGVMYDTGGLSLKPTAGSMDSMKSDMAGAAGVAATMFALASNKMPVWVIALIPATDNRPDGNAYTPGDVIKMYNGLHVEVMNTDAEGRMIMADALSYADNYEPELVIDMATLTGSAAVAIGKAASVCMGNAHEKNMNKLLLAGEKTHERLVKFPFWDDYKESLKSSIADLKNLGGRDAGAISAGKFLEHFTKSPYIHIDIAGTAFLDANDSYRLKGGTGIGVRLLTEFFKIISKPS